MNLQSEKVKVGDLVYVIRQRYNSIIITCAKCRGTGQIENEFCSLCTGSGKQLLRLHDVFEILPAKLVHVNFDEAYDSADTRVTCAPHIGVVVEGHSETVVYPTNMVHSNKSKAISVRENLKGGAIRTNKSKSLLKAASTRLKQLEQEARQLKMFLGELALDML